MVALLLFVLIVGSAVGWIPVPWLPRADQPTAVEEVSAAGPAADAEPGPVAGPEAVRRVTSGAARGAATLRVRVLHYATGLPVADAEVVYPALDGTKAADVARDWELSLRSNGVIARTNAAGIAECVPGYGEIIARSGRLFAEGLVPDLEAGEDRTLTLIVAPDLSVSVTVLDAKGQPAAGVDVHLTGEPVTGGWWEIRGKTDGQGIAYFFHVASHEEVRRHLSGVPKARAEVRLPSGEVLIGVIPDDAPQHATLTLRLPPSGRIRCTCRTSGGRALAWPTGFALWLVGGSTDLDPATGFLTDDRATITFNPLPLGQRFLLTGRMNGYRIAETIVGPRRDGEEVHFELVTVLERFGVRGRALDENRSPGAGAGVILIVGGVSAIDFTDAAGRFHAVVELDARVERVGLEMSLRVQEWFGQAQASRVWKAVVPGDYDAGDLVLTAPVDRSPLLCSGRLLRAGKVVRPAVEPQRCRCGDGRHRWHKAPSSQRSVDNGFEFRLLGVAKPTDHYRLLVPSALGVRKAFDIRPGQANIEIEVAALGGLELRLRLKPGVPADELVTSLPGLGPGGVYRGPYSLAEWVDGQQVISAVFELDEVPVGRQRVEVRLGATVLAAFDVDIVPDQITRLVGDRSIDLRDCVDVVEIQLIDNRGQPDPTSKAIAVTEWAAGPQRADRGRIRVAVPPGRTTISVVAPDCVPRLLELPPGRHAIAPQPMRKLVVRAVLPVEQLPEGIRPDLRVTPLRVAGLDPRLVGLLKTAGLTLGEERSLNLHPDTLAAELRLPAGCEVLLEVVLYDDRGEVSAARKRAQVAASTSRLSIAVSAAQWRAALAELRR